MNLTYNIYTDNSLGNKSDDYDKFDDYYDFWGLFSTKLWTISAISAIIKPQLIFVNFALDNELSDRFNVTKTTTDMRF